MGRMQSVLALGLGLMISGGAFSALDEQEVFRDENGRIVRIVHEDGREISYAYDDAGRLRVERHSDGKVIRYDENGNVIESD